MSTAPTTAELLQDPVVLQAIEDAWNDSLPDDPLLRHEEGGWIFMDVTSRSISVRRQSSGGTASIDLSNPPIVPGSVVVGKFHTHPNPTAEGWNPGPSRQDQIIDNKHGVPDLIRADNDIYFSGPDSRRGGLVGGPGYPP